jgi:hypothetical protein
MELQGGVLGHFKRWADARQGVPGFPVQETHLALYLTHLSESTGSKAAIEEALHALAWCGRSSTCGGVTTGTGDSSGFEAVVGKAKKRKEPITAEMLKLMVESVGLTPSLTEVRLLAVCLLAFAGFMRCDEMIKLHGGKYMF